ncbi:MAG TPA: nuclear transport factor 2 family protein [Sporichthya sp.]|nr:nuclear transport factor 2 family protein [Sporichthya sp.]
MAELTEDQIVTRPHVPLDHAALPAAVARGLETWHSMIATGDLSEVRALLDDDVRFSSPAFWHPYAGPTKVAHVLQTAVSVFEDFRYEREFATSGGHDLVLEFAARLGDLELKGIDMIAFDTDGLITRFEVMIRPMKSLAAVAERMKASLDLTLMGMA